MGNSSGEIPALWDDIEKMPENQYKIFFQLAIYLSVSTSYMNVKRNSSYYFLF